jgi:putative endonuclease
MAFVYLIISTKNNRTISYVGWTNNLEKRIKLHNSGNGAKFTKGRLWKLIYYEIFTEKNNAMKREYTLKKDIKLRNLIKKNFFENMKNEK